MDYDHLVKPVMWDDGKIICEVCGNHVPHFVGENGDILIKAEDACNCSITDQE